MSMQSDRMILRELAKQVMEIAVSEKHQRMRQRFCDSNDLKIVRPPLIMEEIPWFEMNVDDELTNRCEDERAQEIETRLRRLLYREKHFACDNYIEPFYSIPKANDSTGNGFEIAEKIISMDAKNNIVSHEFHDVLEDEAALDKYHDPVITARPDIDEANKNFAQEMFGDILPVRLIGQMTYFAPWDVIPRLHGVDNVLYDLVDRPEFMHKVISLFTRANLSEIKQKIALGLYSGEAMDIHCTPGAITYDENDGKVHTWFRTMAQMFSSISPDMHDEFDVQYSLPLSELFSYTYYGCCEPLHDRLDVIKQYRNLRKIGVSPWADVEKSAEAIGGNYVLSRKPNPAFVAKDLNEEVVRKEIEDTVKLCVKYGCPCDITLKDISTVSYRPQNLMKWSEIAAEVLNRYYDLP